MSGENKYFEEPSAAADGIAQAKGVVQAEVTAPSEVTAPAESDAWGESADLNVLPSSRTVALSGEASEITDGQAESVDISAVDAPPLIENVEELANPREVIERIDASLAAFNQRASEYEATNRLLHARVEELQHDQVRSLLKPVFERLASLHAQATEAAGSTRDRDAGSAEEFDFFATSIDELLGLYDIDSVGAAVGQPFDSKRHHATRVKSTDVPELDGIVQRLHRQGYTLAGSDRVLLPARVSVYRFAGPGSGSMSANALP